MINEQEKAKLQKIADDKVALDALRKVFLYNIYYQGNLNENTEENCFIRFGKLDSSNEILGQQARAITFALELFRDAFKELENYKTNTNQNEYRGENPAR